MIRRRRQGSASGRQDGRTGSAAVLLVAALATAGCGPGLTEADLPPVPTVATQGFLGAVRAQLADARRGADAEPLDADANGSLGMHYLAYHLNEAAEVAFHRARLLDPDRHEWIYYHAVTLAELGRHDEAEAGFVAVLDSEPDLAGARTRLAAILAQTGRSDRARGLLEAVLADQPDQHDARLALGRLLVRAGEPQSAVAHLERVAAQVPPPGAAYFALASAYRRLGDRAAMAENLRLSEVHRATTLVVDDPLMRRVQRLDRTEAPLFRQAQREYALGRAEQAVTTLEQALQRNPSSIEVYAALVWIEADLGRFEAADAHARGGLAVDPNFAQLHYAVGRARMREGRFNDAAEATRRAMALDPHRSDIQTQLADILVREGRNGEATAMYASALEVDPKNRAIARVYGERLAAADRWDEAIAILEGTLEPEDEASARYGRIIGEAHEALGDPMAARAAYEAARASAQRTGNRREITVLDYKLRHLPEPPTEGS